MTKPKPRPTGHWRPHPAMSCWWRRTGRLSPRAAQRLQARVRETAGRATPITWVIVADHEGAPDTPDPEHMSRWTAFIDGLRDPATDVAAYDPAA